MIALVLSMTLAQYTPAEAQSLFVESNDAYYKSHYATARAGYEKLLQAGLAGPDVLFNLGTTCLAAGELGPATLYLERAARLSDDDDIGANLSAARQRQVDKVVGAESSSTPFTQRLAAAMDERVVSIAFLTTWFIAFALLWLTWKRSPGRRLLFGLLTSLFLIAGGLLGSAVLIYGHVKRTVEDAIVMPAAAKVREFPGQDSKISFEVHAGLKVRVMETAGPWARIRLPNALEGWTEKEGVVAL